MDDEPTVAFFLGKALERANPSFEVLTAHSGEEALEILNQSAVDLLITDMRMPGISGIELIRWVKASSPHTGTILITAYGNEEVEREVAEVQADWYIPKPFTLRQFTHAVENALVDKTAAAPPAERPTLVVLSDEVFDEVIQHLEDLRFEISCRCIILSDMQGQLLTSVGDTSGLDTATLLALLSGGFVASTELARRFGDGKALNLNFHEGTRYEIYSANIGDDMFIAIVYDRTIQTSRIGIVWLYTRRLIEELTAVLTDAATNATVQQPHRLGDDFGTSLTAELDSLFPSTADEGEEEEETDVPEAIEEEPEERPAPSPEPPSPPEGETPDGETSRELFSLEDAIARGIIPPEVAKNLL